MNTKALQEFYNLKQQIDELTKQAEILKKNLKTEIEKGEHSFGEWQVSYVQRTRIDLDKELITKELGDKIKAFEKISAYEVFMVKKK